MKKYHLYPRFLLFLWLIVFATSCQNVLSGGGTTPSYIPVATGITPQATIDTFSASTSPVSTPYLKLTRGVLPPFILSRGSFPKKAGVYLVYDGTKYMSLDGTTKGNLLRFITHITNGIQLPQIFMTSSQESPNFTFMDYSNKSINVWITDAIGNPLRSWHGEFEPNNDMNCNLPSVSSRGHWLVFICHDTIVSNIFFVNLETGEEKLVDLGVICNTAYSNRPNNGFPEPGDRQTWWSIQCSEPDVYCFISSTYDKAICQSFSQRPISISPDGEKVVLLKGDMPHNQDRTVSGIQIEIVDRKCLLGEVPCGKGQKFDLPYYEPIQDANLQGPWFSFNWDPTGQNLVWQNSPIAYLSDSIGTIEAPSTVGLIDLEKNTNQILWHKLPIFTNLVGRSPDGKWLAFSDLQGLYLGSIDGQRIHRLIDTGYSVGLYGWLVVP